MADSTIVCNLAAITDIGMVRKNNEDNLIVVDLITGQTLTDRSNQTSYPASENALLLVVSDGMGGAECGEVASELTVLAIKDALKKMARNISAHDRLVAAVEEANHIVWNTALQNPKMKGMGATATAALIDGNQVYIAEVGDSRAYLLRNNNIKQVTTDQSFVAQLIAKGLLKPEDAVEHPRKNVILQSVGVQEIVQVAVSMFELRRHDIIILCSDGLSNLVETGEILFFAGSFPPDVAAKRLVEIAKERGGNDNITVIIAKFEGPGLVESAPTKGLTGMLQTLSIFNPEEEAEKTHKRTQLLGNASIGNLLYGNNNLQPQVNSVTTMVSYPNSEVIRMECERLIEWLDYCHQVFQIKNAQIEVASDWLVTQGSVLTNLEDALEEVKIGVEHIEKARERAKRLMKYLQ